MNRAGFSKLHAIVLAGGEGRRMQGFALRYGGCTLPKQYCRFGRKDSLLQTTLARVTRLVSPSKVSVVVSEAREAVARLQLREFLGTEIVAQPRDRGTGTGLLLPLVKLLNDSPEAIVLLTPADHGVANEREYWLGVGAAHNAVASLKAEVVLLGAEADAPRTDYGWIVPAAFDDGPLRSVGTFVEKPPLDQARRLFEKGALWNTMVLVARASALADVFRSRLPEHVARLQRVFREDRQCRREAIHGAYQTLEHADFSHDVLAATQGLHVWRWPRRVGWSDLGTPDRMESYLQGETTRGRVSLRRRTTLSAARRLGSVRRRGRLRR